MNKFNMHIASWISFLVYGVRLGMARSLALSVTSSNIIDDVLILTIPHEKKYLINEKWVNKIRDAFNQYIGKEYTLKFELE